MHDKHSPEHLRILHLEDELRDADLLCRRLDDEGICYVRQVVNREEDFLAALKQDHFDLILAEIQLRECDGLSALRLAKNVKPDVPFIFITRVLDERKEVEALTSGASEYLLKERLGRLSLAIRRSISKAEQPDIRKIGREMEGLLELAESFESAHDPVILHDLQDRIVFWNMAAERLYGWQRAEVLGKRIPEVFPKNLPVYTTAKQEVMQRGEWKHELAQTTKQGREVIIDACWTLVRNKNGKPKLILAKNTDITERKRLESRSLRAQRMEAIGTLTSGIAHDLNNMLAPVMLSASLLRSTEPATAEFEDMLQTIEFNVQRGADLIKQLLAFCRGAEGKHSIIRLNHLITKIGSLAQQTFPRTINIVTEVPDDLWAIKGDSTQIDQVLLNLCLNARDAMPDGGFLAIKGENFRIQTTNSELDGEMKPGPYVRLAVTDTGVGIPQEIVDKIFEPFFTTKEPGKGTGLGLSTAQGIVRAHKGLLRVRSEEGKGSTFEVYLPAVTEKLVAKENEPLRSTTAGHGQSILLVDDESAILTVAQRVLRLSGYNAMIAHDGSEAISLFVQNHGRIELVISDIVMPSMDGVTLMELIRKIDPAVKLIASSGFKEGVGPERLSHLERLGVCSLLEKPYTIDKLLSTVGRALDEHKLQSSPSADGKLTKNPP